MGKGIEGWRGGRKEEDTEGEEGTVLYLGWGFRSLLSLFFSTLIARSLPTQAFYLSIDLFSILSYTIDPRNTLQWLQDLSRKTHSSERTDSSVLVCCLSANSLLIRSSC